MKEFSFKEMFILCLGLNHIDTNFGLQKTTIQAIRNLQLTDASISSIKECINEDLIKRNFGSLIDVYIEPKDQFRLTIKGKK